MEIFFYHYLFSLPHEILEIAKLFMMKKSLKQVLNIESDSI